MIARLERRLRSIVYQLLRNHPAVANITAVQRVRLARRIYEAALTVENLTFEDISALVTRVFDVVVTWVSSSQLILRYDYIEVSDDYANRLIDKIVESISLAYLDNEPWMLEGYTDEEGQDPFLEFSVERPHNIPNVNIFATVWKTDAVGPTVTLDNQIRLPLHPAGFYDFVVVWGDGSEDAIVTHDQSQVTHTYAAPGTYEVMIEGTCNGFGFTTSPGDQAKLIDVQQWGLVRLHNYGAVFRNCRNLPYFSALDTPELQGHTNFQSMFAHASAFNGAIDTWNMSSAVTTENMFAYATSFDQPLGSWSFPQLVNARRMFHNATAFEQDISTWCIPKITSEPTQFSVGSKLTTALKPVWGSCNF